MALRLTGRLFFKQNRSFYINIKYVADSKIFLQELLKPQPSQWKHVSFQKVNVPYT